MSSMSEDDKLYRKALEALSKTYGRTFKTRDTIFSEGDTGKEVFFIVSGAVCVYLGRGDNRKNLLNLWAGDIFGEMALLDKQPRSASVEASLQTVVLAFEREAFNHLIGNYPILAQKVIELMGRRMRTMDQQHKAEIGYRQT